MKASLHPSASSHFTHVRKRAHVQLTSLWHKTLLSYRVAFTDNSGKEILTLCLEGKMWEKEGREENEQKTNSLVFAEKSPRTTKKKKKKKI